MGALIGFILIPLALFVVVPLVVIRTIGVKVSELFKLRWSGIIVTTLLELAYCFIGTAFFEQRGWGGNVGLHPGSGEIYKLFGSFFWQLFSIALLVYGVFYALSFFTFKNLLMKGHPSDPVLPPTA